MKNFAILLLVACVGYGAYQKLNADRSADTESIESGDEPYIAIYGRDTCSFTAELRSYLDSCGLPYKYFSVDNKKIADRLHRQMNAAGISTAHYDLPVVDVSGELSVRPPPQQVLSQYGRAVRLNNGEP